MSAAISISPKTHELRGPLTQVTYLDGHHAKARTYINTVLNENRQKDAVTQTDDRSEGPNQTAGALSWPFHDACRPVQKTQGACHLEMCRPRWHVAACKEACIIYPA